MVNEVINEGDTDLGFLGVNEGDTDLGFSHNLGVFLNLGVYGVAYQC